MSSALDTIVGANVIERLKGLRKNRGVEITEVGCPFFNRCPLGIEGTCDVEDPPIRQESPDHQIACHLTLDGIEEASLRPQEILHGFDRIVVEDEAKRRRPG